MDLDNQDWLLAMGIKRNERRGDQRAEEGRRNYERTPSEKINVFMVNHNPALGQVPSPKNKNYILP